MRTILKDSFREIKRTYRRFISIILMALLGVMVFVGIGASGDNIAHTVGEYFKKYNIYDLKLSSTLGLTDEDVEAIKKVEGVTSAIPTYEKDVTLEINDSQYVISAMEYNENVNKVEILEGAYPSTSSEVMIDKKLSEEQNIKVGDTLNLIEILEENEDPFLNNSTVTVSAIINTPLYITEERGTSKLGAGKVDYYLYLNSENINSDIYTTIYINSEKLDNLLVESKDYREEVETLIANINNISEERKQARYDGLVNDANTEINDAQAKLDEEKQKAEDEISKAEQDIKDAENEIAEAEQEIESNKQKADTEFANARKQIEDNEKIYQEKVTEAENGKTQIKEQIATLNSNLTQLTDQLASLNQMYEATEDETVKQKLEMQIQELEKYKTEVENGINTANNTIIQIDEELANGKEQLENAKAELNREETSAYNEIENARQEIADAKAELEDGKVELNEQKAEAESKIADAQKELNDAKEEVSKIEYPTWYLWDRKEANTGYSIAMQYSEILSTVSKVFPVIFFAVATLMSLNAMTRMVDEERTQIGTLKAMGYNKIQIATKYILYAALATIIGNVAGVFIGFEVLTDIIESLCLETYTNVPIGPIIYDWNLAFIGCLISAICIIGGAIYASYAKLIIIYSKSNI